jgi:hypothetical protein
MAHGEIERYTILSGSLTLLDAGGCAVGRREGGVFVPEATAQSIWNRILNGCGGPTGLRGQARACHADSGVLDIRGWYYEEEDPDALLILDAETEALLAELCIRRDFAIDPFGDPAFFFEIVHD